MILLILIFLLSLSTCADASVFIDGYVDIDQAKTKVTSQFPSSPSNDRSESFLMSGFSGGGGLGYRFLISPHFSLASQVNWDGSNTRSKTVDLTPAATYYYEKNNTLSWQINPEFNFANSRIFLDAGMAFSELKRHGNQKDFIGVNFRKPLWPGYLVGLGLSENMAPHWAVFVNYQYIGYKKIHLVEPSSTAGQENATNEFSGQNILLGLEYQFDKHVMQKIAYAFHRFYLSLNAGYAFNDIQESVVNDVSNHYSLTGAIFGSSIGWRMFHCPHFIAALEGFSNYTATNWKLRFNSNTSNNDDLRIRYNYGLAFVPGIVLHGNSELYVKGGFSMAEIEQNGTFSHTNGITFTKTMPGYLIGFGLSQPISDHLGLKIEYNHTDYKDIHKTSINNTKYEYSPKENSVVAGLVVNF